MSDQEQSNNHNLRNNQYQEQENDSQVQHNLSNDHQNEQVDQSQDQEQVDNQGTYRSNDPHNNDNNDEEFGTPAVKAQQQYLSTQDFHEDTQSSSIKKSMKKKSVKTFEPRHSQNFVERNLQVKPLKAMQQESILMQKQRFSEVQMRKTQNSIMWSSQSKILDKTANSRLQDWEQLHLKQRLIEKEPSSTGIKNKSNACIVDHDTAINSVGQANSLGAAFSKSKKELHYHMTNASQVTMQNSYKTLDCPEKTESEIFPAKKNGVDQKFNLNQSKVLGNSHYVKEEDVREGYNSHQEKTQIVHNINNNVVQSQRLKTYHSSQVF